jgi:hypothetical protein
VRIQAIDLVIDDGYNHQRPYAGALPDKFPAWGVNHGTEAKYLNVNPSRNDGKAVYKLTVGSESTAFGRSPFMMLMGVSRRTRTTHIQLNLLCHNAHCPESRVHSSVGIVAWSVRSRRPAGQTRKASRQAPSRRSRQISRAAIVIHVRHPIYPKHTCK